MSCDTHHHAVSDELRRQEQVARVAVVEAVARILWMIATAMSLAVVIGVIAAVIAIIRWIAGVG